MPHEVIICFFSKCQMGLKQLKTVRNTLFVTLTPVFPQPFIHRPYCSHSEKRLTAEREMGLSMKLLSMKLKYKSR